MGNASQMLRTQEVGADGSLAGLNLNAVRPELNNLFEGRLF
jgi:hypothetical protein